MKRLAPTLLAAGLLLSCARLQHGGLLASAPPPLRAGVFDLRWRRPMIETAGLDWRPVFRATPTYDRTNDVLYVGSVDNGMYALRGRDGAVVWRFETLARVDATATLDGADLFFGSADGAMYAVDATTGAMRWRFGTPAEVHHAPVVTADTVYFVNANDTVIALGRADGAVRWRYRRGAPGGITLSGHAGLARAGNRLYTGFADGVVVCLDTRDGSLLWEQDTSADIDNLDERNEAHQPIDVDTTPVLLNDTVYVASFTAGLYALDAVGGGQRWRVGDVTAVAGLSTDGRYLYAASTNLGLLKIEPFDGTLIWARSLDSQGVVGAAPMPGGLLAVPTTDRALWVLRASDGEPVDGIAPGRGFGGLPVVSGNRFFVESNGAVVYAFNLTRR